MIDRIAIERYARALLEIAVELNEVNKFEEELKWVDSVLKENNRLFLFFRNPLVERKNKKELADKILAKNISLKLKNFVYLLIDKRRTEFLEGIFEIFQVLADEHRGMVKASVQSAIELSSDKIEAIRKRLEQKLDKTIKIKASVHPEIIGGIIIYIGSSVIDRSLKGRLKVLREQLLAKERG